MGIMIIPMVSSPSKDALHAVPDALREGAYTLGASKLSSVGRVVLPSALSRIMASVILAVSRAIGETNQVFTSPQDARTEDHITGKFG